MKRLNETTMYEALLNQDSRYEGLFWVAVKTTGIFCRPTCTARKPKRENVEFFSSTHEALFRGYRPCKICKPMARLGEQPEWLEPLMKRVEQSGDKRFRDWDIRQLGLDPNRVRRWFKKHHGMTFQAYLRALRLGNAMGLIHHGEKVSHAAWDSGYESVSGFQASIKNATGHAAGQGRQHQVIHSTRLLTPLGPMVACAVDEGICLLEFADRPMLETNMKRIAERLNGHVMPGRHDHFILLKNEIDEYFEGRRRTFSVPLVLAGTDFQECVWRILQTIPYGQTRSYLEQAHAIAKPLAVRAVARANGDNRIAIIIPCHRVIGSDGKLVGYGGGLWRKQHLLDLEQGRLRR